MARLEMMEIFVAVAEEQSFAGGARRLNLSAPAVTRAVAALEERLGVKLLTRTTRYVRLTDAGQRYLEDARRIVNEANEADETAAGINAEPRGHLSVTAPVLFGRMFVIPGIVAYLQRFPTMEIAAVFLDRIVNMLEEGIDVGIRIGELPDSSLRAIRVGHVRQVLCASPGYLSEKGTPKSPDALSRHSLVVAATGSWSAIEWKFLEGEKIKTYKIKPRLSVTSNDAAIAAAIEGLGITRVMSYQAAPFLASGHVQTLLSDYEPNRLPIHVLHREGRYASAKVRTFVDLMVERLRADPFLN
ncbi:LysR family transcriptional regulator [Methylicorpusculum oleiharenae]|uniref:LysR family transcriptional regulator n=1 Tax=Methylicorpusculum oleiharenae TaxID=1338687 RepID=UPI0013587221|nr:LysR family transcriptional regulator [Methylicorpusculum oleiharenae]MCD2451586.1 LysR family transcriptional regulator [Methylicorpusculum oleiharenae]